MQFIPRDYQQEAIEFIIQHKYCGVLLDVGMGKTVTALTAMYTLLYDYFENLKILVITSKILAENIWIQEFAKWNHLNCMKYSIVMGKEKERHIALRKKADVYITNIEDFNWILKNGLWMFDVLILDEFYRCKNEKSRYFKNIVSIRKQVKRVIGLGNTLMMNELEDIWSLCFLLDGGERLGRNKQGFCDRYFFTEWKLKDTKWSPCREAKRGAEEVIHNEIKDIFYCKAVKEKVSGCVYKNVCVEMSPSEYSKYHWLEQSMNQSSHSETMKRKYSLEIISRLMQAANGIWSDGVQQKYFFHERKLEALNHILGGAESNRILIAYSFLQDKERIVDKYPEAVCIDSVDQVIRWNQGNNRIGIINIMSNAIKLSLEKGTDILVWYSLPWDYEKYGKLNSKIMGRKGKKIIIHLIMLGTIEERMFLLLRKKHMGINQLEDRECYGN